MQILRNESRTVLQKVFQHNVCNNNDFIVQTVSEMYVQCVRYSEPLKTMSLLTDAMINEALW